MKTLNGQWLQIFRAGDYGSKGKYTVPQLTALATSYNPAVDEAPICIGHPEHNAPAFGSIKALRMDGDVLLGMPGEVPPVIDAAVQGGAYKKRSVSFIRRQDGSLRLRHLGLLGGMPPEVTGLRDAQFGSEAFEEVEFSEGEEMDQAAIDKTIGERITAFFAERFGAKPETGTVTQADITRAANEAAAAATTAARSEFAAQLQTEREARQQLEVRFAATNATGTAERLMAQLKVNKRWLPAYDHMGVPQLFAQLTQPGVQEIEFSVEGKPEKKAPAQVLFDFLNGIGQVVPEGVMFSADKGLTAPKPAAVPNVEGVDVDAASVTFNAQVTAYAAEKNIPFNEAFTTLTKQGKRPAMGAAAAGAV